MRGSTDDILGKELGKLGALGAQIGGQIGEAMGGSAPTKASESGASFGASLAAKFLPTEVSATTLTVHLSAEQALKRGYSVLSKLGEVHSPEGSTAPYPALKAVVGSGFLKMNPAVVYFEILSHTENTCEITLTAAAKEGLIKQRTAAKALSATITALHEAGVG